MSDLFAAKHIKPMLIGAETEAFDSEYYIYELKLDGERCVAYLDPQGGTDLRNKRNIRMLPKVPELGEIHRHVRCRCILDGELAVIKDGKPDFAEIQRRSIMDNPLKIELASRSNPACFTAFDILYYEDHPVNLLPVMERKRLLESVIAAESPRFARSAISRKKASHSTRSPNSRVWRASLPSGRTACIILTNAQRIGSSASCSFNTCYPRTYTSN